MMFPAGKWFRGYLSNDALNTDAAIPLFDEDGTTLTLLLNQRLLVQSITITNGATASIITIYTDRNGNAAYDAGEELVVANLPVNGSIVTPANDAFNVGSQSDGSAKGKLRAVASAASVGTRITVIGRILSN